MHVTSITHKKSFNIIILLLWGLFCIQGVEAKGLDPLPTWNDGATKQQIINYVEKVTKAGGNDFVEPAERIAVIDNDGTLWPEQPMYVQLAFMLDRIKVLAPNHPEWKDKQPFKAALENNFAELEKLSERDVLELVMATHAGMTTGEFEAIVKDWLATAHHPRFNVPYTDLVYQPMVELLAYLRANGFKTYIVSGGGVEFMRPWTEKAYGVPPEQVIGSSIKVKYEMSNGKPVLMRLPEISFIDDKAGKPQAINLEIGRQPIVAVGNSDGDYEMLQWTTLRGDKPTLGMIVHHDDAKREWAYDKHSSFGRLDKAMSDAKQNHWTLISMKNDWKIIFNKSKVN